MARLGKKVKENADGNFFVDSTCIACGACARFAPRCFADAGEYFHVREQPRDGMEKLSVQRALLSCPAGSIGAIEKEDLDAAKNSFPLRLAGGVFINGFNARDSYGADSYFIASPQGNWLVDSPRFAKSLVRKFEAMGGIKYIFLTHQDDVADAHLYARHFQAMRIIHQLDSEAQKDAELILKDGAVHEIDRAKIVFAPGHTRGHLVLLWDGKYLFTGDHFAWLEDLNRFGPFRDACWYSWEVQAGSVARLGEFGGVEWVFPGHGGRRQVAPGSFPEIVGDAVAWMKAFPARACHASG